MQFKKLLLLFALFGAVALTVLFVNQSFSTIQANAADLSKFFGDKPGAFVLYDLKNNEYIRYNDERCRQRFSPFSTFKIPNSLIALETGVVKDEKVVTPYEREKHPPEAWWPTTEWQRDQNLRSAIKESVVWYYQDIAKQVGKEKYEKYLKQFHYGNEDVSGSIDEFWINNSLQISPNEQVEFLKKFYKGELSISNRTTDIVKNILVLEDTNSYKLSGKTGTSSLKGGKTVAWLVGYLEKPDDVYFFATNLEGKNYDEVSREKRLELTKRIFAELGLL